MAFSNTRRTLLLSGAGAMIGAALPITRMAHAQSTKQITVADPGGAYQEAFRKAFYDPFEKDTGIKVVSAARSPEPTAQIKAMVETGSYTWDASILTMAARDILLEQDLLDPLNLDSDVTASLLPEAVTPYWMGTDAYATIFAYRTDVYGDDGPQSWADFWDAEKFEGLRAMSGSPIDTLEQALLADGVAMEDLYPLDMDRAFKSLDRIREHVAVWWTGGAQSAHVIQSGEVDMVASWNGRMQAVADGGAPIKTVWEQGLYAIEGWGILKGGPNVDTVREFVAYCADAERQAAYTSMLSYGPTNRDAYDFIDPERAAILPTHPDNLKRMVNQDVEWWAKNRAEAVQRFDSWLIA